MEIFNINMLDDLKLKDNITLTIGNFECLHLGHQALIKECVKLGNSAVLTFNPHPSKILKNEANFLLTIDEKIEYISKLNPTYLIIVNFNDLAMKTKKEEFINWLKHLNVKTIVCGLDTRFGYKNEGSISDLEKEFKVFKMATLTYNDLKISSSNVKDLLQKGDIKSVNIMLNRYYSISGLVIEGYHNGEKLGYRTANLDIKGKIAPKRGVYACYIYYNNEKYLGMGNVGINPTIGKLNELRLEVHIFNFDKIIYGEEITVEFIDFIRDETKFESFNHLKNQLASDMEYIKNNFK